MQPLKPRHQLEHVRRKDRITTGEWARIFFGGFIMYASMAWILPAARMNLLFHLEDFALTLFWIGIGIILSALGSYILRQEDRSLWARRFVQIIAVVIPAIIGLLYFFT